MKQVNNFVFFWTNVDVFSNWHPSEFTVDGVRYNCAEQYMMHRKATLFRDATVAEAVLGASHPKEQKALGRQVHGFDEAVWTHHREPLMVKGLTAKFHQNPEMGDVLLATGDAVLVEASPYDQIWGVGLSKDDPRILDPKQWRGLNLQGQVLMQARTQLKQLREQPLHIPQGAQS